MKRRHPEWAKHVNDDVGNSIDVILKLDTPNTHTLVGWGFVPSHLMFMCYTNGKDEFPSPVPKMELIDWCGVSDSTWLMKSAKINLPIIETTQFKAKIPRSKMNAISGSVATTIIAGMSSMLAELLTEQCKGASATVRGSGIPHSFHTATRVQDPGTVLTTHKDGTFHTLLIGTVLLVT
jgi:hypothetical protein